MDGMDVTVVVSVGLDTLQDKIGFILTLFWLEPNLIQEVLETTVDAIVR